MFSQFLASTLVSAMAQSGDPDPVAGIRTLFNNILTWGTSLALIVAAVFLMYGAYLYMMAGGSPHQMERGKSAMAHAVVGFIIVLFAKTIVSAVGHALR